MDDVVELTDVTRIGPDLRITAVPTSTPKGE